MNKLTSFRDHQVESSARGQTPATFTLADRIEQSIKEAQRRLEAARRAQELLKANPDMEELLNLLQIGAF